MVVAARGSTMTTVLPTAGASVRLRPVGLGGVTIKGGLWAERQHVNRQVTLPHGARQLEAAGNLANLRAAATGSGTYAGEADDSGLTFPFLDSDVYKWLEALAWEFGRAPDDDLSSEADATIDLVARAQREDGYLNSYFQLATPGRQFHDLEWGHELYTIGHLVQAAIAWQRALDDERLVGVAERAVERIGSELGPGRRELVDGHPEIEMALVELYRTTGAERHLELARTLLERRGRGLLRPDRFGADYWQDHASVREADEPAGHAVRQLYLDCGAVDLAVETGDGELLDAVRHRWDVMVATRTYLTGGLGARQRDEAFGEAFELPPDVAYAETCAAIASVMLAWRLLLATGEPKYADLVERTSLNGLLAGLALDGSHFFYANPLQVRSGAARETRGPTSTRRRAWYPCACCPPNLMRFISAFGDLVASSDDDGLHIHQIVAGTIEAELGVGRVALRLETDYPWDGGVLATVMASPQARWTASIRVPAWCEGGTLAVNDEAPQPVAAGAGEVAVDRAWRAGDLLRLNLDMPPRFTMPDPRIDAARGTIAIERGPLVYALEERDLPSGTSLEDVVVDSSQPPTVGPPQAELAGVAVLEVSGRSLDVEDAPWPYGQAAAARDGRSLGLRAVPYFAWGNRGPGGMRVWLPRAE